MLTQRQARHDIARLVLCQALQATIIAGTLTTAALAGLMLLQQAQQPIILATLPAALLFAAALASTSFISQLMAKRGRKSGFIIGISIGFIGYLVAGYALMLGSFSLFCLSSLAQGAFLAASFYYRFTAIDVVDATTTQHDHHHNKRQAQAIAWVLSGSVVAAFSGPNLASWSSNWIEGYPYVGNYLVYAGLSLISLLIIAQLHVRLSVAVVTQPSAKDKQRLRRSPVFVTAVMGSFVSYAVMSLIMNATPLAMQHHHGLQATAMVIQWHIFAMYAPSFFMGMIITRLGAPRVMQSGLMAYVICIAINTLSPSGADSFYQYLISLFLLGIGWNALFVSATHLLGLGYTGLPA